MIPQNIVKALVGGIVTQIKDSKVTDSFNKEFDKQVKEDARKTTNLWVSCHGDGWPYEAVKQEKIMLGNNGKLSQTCIREDHFSQRNK